MVTILNTNDINDASNHPAFTMFTYLVPVIYWKSLIISMETD